MKQIILMFAIGFLLATSVLAIVPPANLVITHNGTNVLLSWDAAVGADVYKVYSSTDPYGEFVLDEEGTYPTLTSWTKPDPEPRDFFQINSATVQAPINLGAADDFVILSKTGITNVPTSAITGNIGVSPAAATYITGFTLIMDPSGTFSTSTQVVGHAYAANYGTPTPAYLTAAINDMQTAYTEAAGRSNPDFINLGAGNLSGLTLEPGLYKWGTGVLVTTSVTLDGGPNDVWVFQISNDLTLGTGASVVLTGGAKAKNVFWQAAGLFSLGTGAHLEGNMLSSTAITMGSGASVNGRMLAQTAVTLNQNTITKPAP